MTSSLPPGPSTIDLAPVLGRVSLQLSQLAGRVSDLQTTFSPFLIDAARARPDLMTSLQSLDMIGQTLSNLSGFLSKLEREPARIGASTLQDALSAVSLTDLRRQLCGEPVGLREIVADDLELF